MVLSPQPSFFVTVAKLASENYPLKILTPNNKKVILEIFGENQAFQGKKSLVLVFNLFTFTALAEVQKCSMNQPYVNAKTTCLLGKFNR